MSELVKRLRAHVNSADLHAMDRLMVEAADEIGRLQRGAAAHYAELTAAVMEQERLRAAIGQLRQARLTWGMACSHQCEACDEFWEAFRAAPGHGVLPNTAEKTSDG